MRKVYFFYSIIAGTVLLPFTGKAQYFYNRLGAHNEWVFGIGPSQALTDVGGSSSVGTHFLKDFNFNAIRYGAFVGYRDYINSVLAVRGSLTGGMISGNDSYSSEMYRHNRNINFRSPIV